MLNAQWSSHHSTLRRQMHERHKWKTRAATMKPVKFQNIDMMCVSGVVALFAQVLSRTVLRYMQFRIVSDRDGVCVYVSIHVHCSLQCYFQNRNEMQKKDSKTQQYSTPSSYTTKSLFEHSITHINNTVTWICNMWSDWKLFRSCCCSLLQCGFIVAPWTIFFSCMQLNFRSGFFDWFGFNAAFHKYKSKYESEL